MPDRKNHQTPTLEKWPKICVETYSPTNAVARKIPESVLPHKGVYTLCCLAISAIGVQQLINHFLQFFQFLFWCHWYYCSTGDFREGPRVSTSTRVLWLGVRRLRIVSRGSWQKSEIFKNESAIYTWLCKGNSSFTCLFFRCKLFLRVSVCVCTTCIIILLIVILNLWKKELKRDTDNSVFNTMLHKLDQNKYVRILTDWTSRLNKSMLADLNLKPPEYKSSGCTAQPLDNTNILYTWHQSHTLLSAPSPPTKHQIVHCTFANA